MKKTKKTWRSVIGLVLAISLFFGLARLVKAAVLSGGSLSLSDGKPSSTAVTYTFDWSGVTATSIKCIEVEFATTVAGGTPPPGMVTSGVSNGGGTYVTGLDGWAAAEVAAGTVKLTDATGGTGGNGTVIFGGITNGSTPDNGYYAIFNTYSDEACSTGVDNGTVAFIYTAGQAVSLTVDPSISFTVNSVGVGQTVNGAATTVESTAATIPLGTVTTSANGITAHDLEVTTNAASGYTIYTKYTGVPTYSGATITDHTGDHTTPATMSTATEAFGYTTEDTDYSQFQSDKYAAFTTTNAEIAKATAAVSSETTRVGYEAAIAGTTEAGNYVTTVVLTCTPMY